MSAIDIGIIVFALALAAIGWERGLVGSAMPLAGFIGGVAIGGRLAPALLEGGSESPYAPAVAAAGGILLGVFLAIALEGLGLNLRQRLAQGTTSRVLDSLGGALLLAALAFAAAWVFGAVALNVPGHDARSLREAVQRSSILVALNDAFPPSGPLLNVLRRIDPSPEVRGPRADVQAPDGRVTQDPDVQRAAQSVVRVHGSACGLGIEGSGWIAGPGLVATNAHVVAGQDDTEVTTVGGDHIGAEVLHYEPRNDLAILGVDGLSAAPLRLEDEPPSGTAAASAGYPEGGPLTLTPARLGRTGIVISEDSYGRGPVERRMTPFRGEVRNGNSGGPVLDGDGDVLTTVFATSLSDGPPSGLGVPNEAVAAALDGPLDGADTGPCAA
jgi:S1-C subfamily serine protease